MGRRRALAAVWKHTFLHGSAPKEVVEAELGCCGSVEELLSLGMVEEKDGLRLTERGRRSITVVLAGGVFDLLHPGHVFFLERAKALGDVLAVVVARDETVRDRKRIPVVPEEQRVQMLEALKPVDVAILGSPDMRDTLAKVAPDVVALGPDQRHGEEEIERMAAELGLRCRVVRLPRYTACPLPSSRSIINRVLRLFR